MATNLKWRTGFDWGNLILLAAFLVLVIFQEGAVRALGIALVGLLIFYLAQQYRRWNRPGWSQVHFRGMFAYRQILGKGIKLGELSASERKNACLELALNLSQTVDRSEVERMVEELAARGGDYLASLLEAHGRELLPELTPEQLAHAASQLRSSVEIGPELVIAGVTQRDFGELEAARYVVALLKRQAY